MVLMMYQILIISMIRVFQVFILSCAVFMQLNIEVVCGLFVNLAVLALLKKPIYDTSIY